MGFRSRYSVRGSTAFTLIELLVVIGIIAVLASFLLPMFGRTRQQANVIMTLSNMKQMGTAMLAYAGDNNFCLPNRATSSNVPGQSSKWPTLLRPYLQDTRVYSSPIPDVGGKTYKVTDPSQYFVDSANYTSYIYNGMNDLNAYNNPSVQLRINTISDTSSTILLGIPLPGQGQFYMDFSEGAGNNNDVLNKTAFPDGTVYMFCDGSSRLLVNTTNAAANLQRPVNAGTYTDWLWLVDKSQTSVIQQQN